MEQFSKHKELSFEKAVHAVPACTEGHQSSEHRARAARSANGSGRQHSGPPAVKHADNGGYEIAAEAAQLRHVSDRHSGIARQRTKAGFRYRDADGTIIHDRATLERIRRLAVPPAWNDVWICPSENGHIQATGRDARGRKQYRYHPRWRAVRDRTKYEHMLEFGRSLPAIRRRVEADLARPGLPREKVIAAVVRLLERTLARIGNPEYAQQNESFGLTTLRNNHVRFKDGGVELDFRAKSGVHHHSVVHDAKLARILRRCRDLPGSELFQYVDEEGRRHAINSSDINDYLREVARREVTAKDFRTWAASNLALLTLAEMKERRPTKAGMRRAVERVASQLGNTPAVCRKSYIHTAILENYLAGSLPLKDSPPQRNGSPEYLAVERQMIKFLETQHHKPQPARTLEQQLHSSVKRARSKRTRALKR